MNIKKQQSREGLARAAQRWRLICWVFFCIDRRFLSPLHLPLSLSIWLLSIFFWWLRCALYTPLSLRWRATWQTMTSSPSPPPFLVVAASTTLTHARITDPPSTTWAPIYMSLSFYIYIPTYIHTCTIIFNPISLFKGKSNKTNLPSSS